jgi:hypothetical protein
VVLYARFIGKIELAPREIGYDWSVNLPSHRPHHHHIAARAGRERAVFAMAGLPAATDEAAQGAMLPSMRMAVSSEVRLPWPECQRLSNAGRPADVRVARSVSAPASETRHNYCREHMRYQRQAITRSPRQRGRAGLAEP